MFHVVHVYWFRWWWPSDLGNGPESLQQLALGAFITSLIYPPIRHYIKREFEKIHHKLDHVLSGTEEKYVEPEWKEFEHWIVTFGKWLTKPFRGKSAT